MFWFVAHVHDYSHLPITASQILIFYYLDRVQQDLGCKSRNFQRCWRLVHACRFVDQWAWITRGRPCHKSLSWTPVSFSSRGVSFFANNLVGRPKDAVPVPWYQSASGIRCVSETHGQYVSVRLAGNFNAHFDRTRVAAVKRVRHPRDGFTKTSVCRERLDFLCASRFPKSLLLHHSLRKAFRLPCQARCVRAVLSLLDVVSFSGTKCWSSLFG